jgi:tRNA dimethylallyltransferase
MTVAVNTESNPSPKPLALIAGPTASGKSALALALAKLTPSVIINADASQVYRDLRIVSARPSIADETQAPHRLFGYVDGAIASSAAAWAADARAEVEKAQAEGKLPILVGGTGLHIRTLLDGIAPVPDIDPAIRAAVRALDVAEAYPALQAEDAEAAARLSPNDTTRVARALEVVRSTGKPLAAWHADRVGGIGAQVRLCPLILVPPRVWLLARCDARFEMMLQNGGIEEVEALLARQLDPALPVMRAIGVPEIAGLIRGDLSKADATAAAQLATRQYAKRQNTWFRNQPPAAWERIDTQLDGDLVNHFAIKLRNMALTN